MNRLINVFLTLLIHIIVVQTKKANLPSYVQICKQNDPNLDQCIINTLNDLKPQLAVGIPEMRIYPFDPLTIDETMFKTPSIEAMFFDTKLHKGQNFDLQALHFDVANNVLSMNVSYEELLHTGNYSLTGRLLAFQLNGNGRINANYTQIETYAKLSGKRFMKNGKEYLDFQNIDYKLKIGDFKTQFDDLFRDNPQLTAVTNRVLNENSRALLPDFEEVFRNILANYMLGSLRRIFKTFPLNVMLPQE